MRATDLNQGVVYGADTEQTKLDPRLATRFDYDGVFGTVLNRMVIQAVLGHPLTVYGNGSQTRGLINIVDTVECIRLASENPAERGEFRVFNQMTESLSIRQIAETIAERVSRARPRSSTSTTRASRSYDHYYNVKHTALVDLGLKPTLLSMTLIDHLFEVVERHRDRVDLAAIMPTVKLARDRQRAAADRRASWPRRELEPAAALDRPPDPRHRRLGLHRPPRRRRAAAAPARTCASST